MTTDVTLSTLICDSTAINWDQINALGQFVSYTVPRSREKYQIKWNKHHIHYLRNSQHPYYYNSHGTFHVLYPPDKKVKSLTGYDGREWEHKILNPQTEVDFLHVLVKLLISDMFKKRESLLSSNDFYLFVQKTPKRGHAKVLKIEIENNWKNHQPDEFVFRDRATTLHKRDPENPLDKWGPCYEMDFHVDNNLIVLRRQVPDTVNKKEVYIPRRTSKYYRNYRTAIPYLNVKSEKQLKESRMYWFDKFMRTVVTHLNENGVPSRLKTMTPHRVHKLSIKDFNEPQIDMDGRIVAIYDDRFRYRHASNLEPANYHEKLVAIVKNIVEKESWTPQLVVKEFEELTAGDLVLRLQDCSKEDFKPKTIKDELGNELEITTPLLRGYKQGQGDPYDEYYEEMEDRDIVTQSITLNSNDHTPENPDDIDDDDILENKPATAEAYLNYALPTPSNIQHKILNCITQLFLKDIVARPENTLERFDRLSCMGNQLFLFKQKVIGLDGRNLIFKQTHNSVATSDWIKKRTGWDLRTDIIEPSLDRTTYLNYSKPEDINEVLEEEEKVLKNRRFILSEDYVWEIVDDGDRIMHDLPTITERITVESNEYDIASFRPSFTEKEIKAVKKRERLEIIDRILDTAEEDGLRKISFKTLSSRKYTEPLIETKIASPQVTKLLKAYLKEKGFDFGARRGVDVLKLQKGIHYFPDTQQYVVCGKHGAREKEERSYPLRRIIVHQGDTDRDRLQEQFKAKLRPLLEVNFVRYGQYTVYPYPFALIEI